MKRYRTMNFSFDARANTLAHQISDTWEPSVRAQWEQNQNTIRNGLKKEYGEKDFMHKEQNFIGLEADFPSVIFYHNKFLHQIRGSFVIGGYYPALTGVTTLTERILNHLIFALKDDFKLTKEYKEVYSRGSFTDWDKMEEILTSWDILLPETKKHIQDLKKLRHQYAAHFNPVTDTKDRELALKAIHAFQEFIRIQFGGFGLQPWFIEGTKGEFFIKKEYETNPFVQKIYLPNCKLVGPEYELENIGGVDFRVKDIEYPNKEISDDEFKKLREEFINRRVA